MDFFNLCRAGERGIRSPAPHLLPSRWREGPGEGGPLAETVSDCRAPSPQPSPPRGRGGVAAPARPPLLPSRWREGPGEGGPPAETVSDCRAPPHPNPLPHGGEGELRRRPALLFSPPAGGRGRGRVGRSPKPSAIVAPPHPNPLPHGGEGESRHRLGLLFSPPAGGRGRGRVGRSPKPSAIVARPVSLARPARAFAADPPPLLHLPAAFPAAAGGGPALAGGASALAGPALRRPRHQNSRTKRSSPEILS